MTHLRERYGDDELDQGWALEVWNEPNLDCFWTGDLADYLRLYDATVAAVRRAHPTIPVAGPATAAVGWLDAFLDHVDGLGLRPRPAHPPRLRHPAARRPGRARRHGREDVGVWWTEWGPTPTHFHPVNDHPWVATFTARGMLAAARQDAAVACWVASDHFEELGRPPRLVHGGFGLLSVGNLAKPRFWALRRARAARRRGGRRPPRRRRRRLAGAGLGVRRPTERVAVAVWNGTLQQHDWAQSRDDLRRAVRLELDGLPAGRYDVRLRQVGPDHSNLARNATELGVTEWPDDDAVAGTARARRARGPARPTPSTSPPTARRPSTSTCRPARSPWSSWSPQPRDPRRALVARRRRLPGLPAQLRRRRR